MNLLDKIKYTIRFSIAWLLYCSGLLSLVKLIILKDKVIVLMYHRVLSGVEKEETFSHSGIIVDKETFTNQMICLKNHFNLISEKDFLNHINNNIPIKRYSCLITFDDGWLDNYTNAYPILKKLNVPASIFLATDYIGTGAQFWQEKLAALLFNLYLKADKASTAILKKYELDDIIGLTPTRAKHTIREFVTNLKKLQSPDLKVTLDDFFNNTHAGYTGTEGIDSFLNWNHVDEMAKNGVTFGSHSVHHHILTKIPLDTVNTEVNASRQAIKEHTGSYPKTFCYPNGEYSLKIAETVSQAGYEAAFSITNGHVSRRSNLYALPRINIHDEVTNSTPLFMARVLGLM